MKHTFKVLEFNKILELLVEYAYTEHAKERILAMKPYMDERTVRKELRDTSEARYIIDSIGMPPMVSLQDLDKMFIIVKQEGILSANQLEYIGITLTAVKRLKDFLCKSKYLEISLPYYELEMDSLEELRDELNVKIRAGRLDDYASKLLKSLRQDIEKLESKIRAKAEGMLKNNKECFADSFITTRNGRICLPVKKEYKFRINGSVIDKSSTGATLFIEPTVIADMSEALQLLRLDEENEERRLLYELTALVADEIETFESNKHIIEKLDFMFAKGRLSAEMAGKEPGINTERYIKIVEGRHPLMEAQTCVPLNFELGKDNKGIIITGPNTGGKTVALKTVGLFSVMAQCGFHIPCQDANIGMSNQVLCDIGDGQNITENLSTFSSHIKNVMDILHRAGKDSLVILDELGSGTDPTEGMGIAIAILEELKKCGCLFLVTTHYPEVKIYAEKTQNMLNARMTFDRETLKPLYQLVIGEAGESCALYIAKQLGMPSAMLRKASMEAYGTEEIQWLDLSEEEAPIKEVPIKEVTPTIKKQRKINSNVSVEEKFHLGDSVMVYPEKKIGIVCKGANDKGVLQVQMKDRKIWINHKRVKLQVAASQLYPEDYDFAIIFDSVENRKARHKMGKGHQEGIEIITEE